MRPKTIWNARIPTLLGIAGILTGIVATTYLSQGQQTLFIRASPLETPNTVTISNIADTSFTISYLTESMVSGAVVIQEATSQKPKQIADDKDSNATTPSSYFTHMFTLKDLKPETAYTFTIISGQNTYLNNGTPYQVITGKTLSPPTQTRVITGAIVTPSTIALGDVLVYLKGNNIQQLATTVKADGSYQIPLNALRNTALSAYAPLSENTQITLDFFATSSIHSQVKVLLWQANPVPLIILSENYDFLISPATPASIGAALTFPLFSETGTQRATATTLTLTTPKQNESFVDQKPQFRGTAPNGAAVEITLTGPVPLKQTVTAGTSGAWTFRPVTPLLTGQYTLIVRSQGQPSITRTFRIFASGSQVSESATVSATPRVTLTPTRHPSTTSTITPSSPTLTLPPQSATPTPIPPTLTPTIFIPPTVIPTTPPPPIQTPGSTDFLLLTIGSSLIASVGIVMFFFTRGMM